MTLASIAARIRAGTNSDHVVIGPVVWQPSDGTAARLWYFTVASSEQGRGFRCDQIVVESREAGEEYRVGLVLALTGNEPLVIHLLDDELAMAALCEVLWPGKRITDLRKKIEAERERSRDPGAPC